MGYSFVNLKAQEGIYDDLLLEWRNKDHVREKMITKDLISFESHEQYLKYIYKTKNYNVYIGFKDGEPFAVVNVWEKALPKVYEYGYYLVNEKDVESGLGVILEYYAIEKIFSTVKDAIIELRTYSYNKKVVSLHKRFGYSFVRMDGDLCIQKLEQQTWNHRKDNIEKLIKTVYGLECEDIINE